MKDSKKLCFVGVLVAVGTLMGCSKDVNAPANLAQQQQMAAGHAPTPQELQRAMSHMKTPNADQISQIPKPSSAGGG
jgi:hypothetical protein